MRKRDFFRRVTGLILLVLLVALGFFQPVRDYLSIPDQITLFENETSAFSAHLPALSHFSLQNETVASSADGKHLKGQQTGHTDMMVLMGNMPAKKVDVRVLPDLRLIPGGESIGVKLNTKGVLVVGYHLVDAANGEKSPGEKAGIQVGDIITKINNKKIESMSDVKEVIRDSGDSGDPLKLSIVRHKKHIQKELAPIKDKNDNKYRIGLYIRDTAAGIGTLTFYEPKSGKYGALGHVISDVDTKQPIVVNDGEIVRSTVSSIDRGQDGHPGEKIASFPADEKAIGDITKNTPFGIFGRLNTDIDNGLMDKGLPIALSNEVKEGPAKILTVVGGSKVEAFDIKVLSSVPQKFPATKGLVIKVTDPKLLKSTGGIVQGMSGSPIIQDGKIIGAVTHVFVNDPTSGYGVHIEWMLEEAGINIYQGDHERKAVS
ncbi:stage IV sporulation protein B [Scopulibacillus darangshiensis]|uniref:Stage IV sporulation protein B n=1 Tax=Scopulibacillus darangshiensis TaxID=442528 RepID=A0A4R2P8C9_9BACL|nr:SpoIVB peptidase [Scopulibacillus darangshiensis]TCP31193.1 stage IV sporulation protein B [Scopulibacillus darangshiensis]